MGRFPVPWTARTSEKVTGDWQAKQCTLLAMDTTLLLFNLLTVEPRYNEGPRDWHNLFAVTRFRYIEILFHVFYYY